MTGNKPSVREKILAFLEANPAATIPAIMAEFGFASANTVHYHIRRLEAEGRLDRPRLEWRVRKR